MIEPDEVPGMRTTVIDFTDRDLTGYLCCTAQIRKHHGVAVTDCFPFRKPRICRVVRQRFVVTKVRDHPIVEFEETHMRRTVLLEYRLDDMWQTFLDIQHLCHIFQVRELDGDLDQIRPVGDDDARLFECTDTDIVAGFDHKPDNIMRDTRVAYEPRLFGNTLSHRGCDVLLERLSIDDGLDMGHRHIPPIT
jgi:hypothetical protein